ncbi:hypothetical protein SEA_FINKLE_77 [Gordonia phage Finkle]|uniref:Uncharacterized protein n=1 Tax=Gordonia phage Finkle TaxID=2926099 RepID=A0A9E7SZD3_9CAUD|nr:hypothetical protein QEH33_gp77 [Gordonia phage Finkle]UTN92991.1 hypothetical protein SEA_FINKLE_77 [Gordonia phage Finkle]
MILPSELRDEAERDLSTMPRDMLEFNYRQIAAGAVEWIDTIEEQHAAELRTYRQHADLGALVLAELRRLQRAGRKTARIDDVLDHATERLARIDRIHGPTECPCPNCRHHNTTDHRHTTEGDHHRATR